jgi:hypothetical protein
MGTGCDNLVPRPRSEVKAQSRFHAPGWERIFGMEGYIDKFEEAVRGSGLDRRLPLESLLNSPLGRILWLVKGHVRGMLTSHLPRQANLKSLPPIYFDIIDTDHVGGFAFKHFSNYFVTITKHLDAVPL